MTSQAIVLDAYCADVACSPEHPCPRCATVPLRPQTMAEMVYGLTDGEISELIRWSEDGGK